MPESLSAADVKKIAALARLGLTDTEATHLAGDVANVLANFAQIQSLDTAGVPASSSVTPLHNVVRTDTAAEELCPPAELLKRAPAVLKKQIKVKAVFE